jgi:hypothetical protein
VLRLAEQELQIGGTRQALLWAEKSAGAGIYCRAWRIGANAGKPGFIGFFVLAWRLLKYVHEWSAAVRGAVGVLPCS